MDEIENFVVRVGMPVSLVFRDVFEGFDSSHEVGKYGWGNGSVAFDDGCLVVEDEELPGFSKGSNLLTEFRKTLWRS